MKTKFPFTPDDRANRLLAKDGTAFLIGMCLDQQVRTEKAFSGPYVLRERVGTIDARKIAAMRPARLIAAFRQTPAIHRYPGMMAKRVRALCEVLAERYGGVGSRVWARVSSPAALYDRLRELPGFGDAKARSAVRILGKYGTVRLPGWRRYASDQDLPWVYGHGKRVG